MRLSKLEKRIFYNTISRERFSDGSIYITLVDNKADKVYILKVTKVLKSGDMEVEYAESKPLAE